MSEEVVAKKSKAELLAERIAASQKQLEDLKRKKKILDRRERVMKSAKERKLDARRKILLGAMLMAEMDASAEGEAAVMAKLDAYLERDADRAVFDLPPLPAQAPAPQGGGVDLTQLAAAALAVDTR